MLRRSPFPRKAPSFKEGPASERPEHPKAKATLSRAPSRCKHCREKFTAEERAKSPALHAHCIEPWAEAFSAKQEAKRKREAEKAAEAERAETKAKLAAFKKIPKLIAEAQESFNAYIRERDKDKGCFVCGRPFVPGVPGRNLHAGHVRTRGAAGHLRFTEDNCMGECEGCNDPKWGAKPHQIKAGAIARIGAERFAELENDNTPHKWTREELTAIKAHYRQKRRELEKENKA